MRREQNREVVAVGMCMLAYCHVMWSALEIAACHKGGMDLCALSGMTEIQLSKVNLNPLCSRNNQCNINVPQTVQQRKGKERVSDVPGKSWFCESESDTVQLLFLGMAEHSGLKSCSIDEADHGTRYISTGCMFAIQTGKRLQLWMFKVMRAKHERLHQTGAEHGYVHTVYLLIAADHIIF